MEETILISDVIARVDLVSRRTSVVQSASYGWWVALLEFRFRVLEYIKGSGPNEIGGVVISGYRTGAEAQAGRMVMSDEHDSRWDDREAIVFLQSDPWYISLELGPGQYWLGSRTEESAEYGEQEAYTVASIHSKLWLPEAVQPGGARSPQSPGEKLFLLDAPAATSTRAGSGSPRSGHAGDGADDQPEQFEEQDRRPGGRGERGAERPSTGSALRSGTPASRGSALTLRRMEASHCAAATCA